MFLIVNLVGSCDEGLFAAVRGDCSDLLAVVTCRSCLCGRKRGIKQEWRRTNRASQKKALFSGALLLSQINLVVGVLGD